MKKIIFLLLVVHSFVSSNAWALDGSGTVEEIKMCHLGPQTSDWKGRLLFKLSDGNWFGLYGDYNSNIATDYDNNIETSLILTSFSQALPINVRANFASGTFCGVTAAILWNTNGDYIHLHK